MELRLEKLQEYTTKVTHLRNLALFVELVKIENLLIMCILTKKFDLYFAVNSRDPSAMPTTKISSENKISPFFLMGIFKRSLSINLTGCCYGPDMH